MKKRIRILLCILLLGCSSSGGGKSDTSTSDVPEDMIKDEGKDNFVSDQGNDPLVQDEGKDTQVPDQGKDSQVQDQGKDTAPIGCNGVGEHIDEHNFCIRTPKEREVPQEGMGGENTTIKMWDKDHVCTLKYKELDGFFYIQANPIKVKMMFGTIYETQGAWVSFNGKVESVPGIYDGGGNHQNDWAKLSYGGYDIKYYHSSFGFGFRACQPMDCLQIFEPGGASPIDDGCTKDRTIPIVCVEVQHDGSVPELKDNFKKCEGDPNR